MTGRGRKRCVFFELALRDYIGQNQGSVEKCTQPA